MPAFLHQPQERLRNLSLEVVHLSLIYWFVYASRACALQALLSSFYIPKAAFPLCAELARRGRAGVLEHASCQSLWPSSWAQNGLHALRHFFCCAHDTLLITISCLETVRQYKQRCNCAPLPPPPPPPPPRSQAKVISSSERTWLSMQALAISIIAHCLCSSRT